MTHYGLILSDPFENTGWTTAVVFTDERIWEQLTTLQPPNDSETSWVVDFPEGVVILMDTDVDVTSCKSTTVTMGSFQNDYAQAICSSPSVVSVDEKLTYADYATDGDYTQALQKEFAKFNVKPEHLYEGFWY